MAIASTTAIPNPSMSAGWLNWVLEANNVYAIGNLQFTRESFQSIGIAALVTAHNHIVHRWYRTADSWESPKHDLIAFSRKQVGDGAYQDGSVRDSDQLTNRLAIMRGVSLGKIDAAVDDLHLARRHTAGNQRLFNLPRDRNDALYSIKLIASHLRRLDFLSHVGHDRYGLGSAMSNRPHCMGHPPDIVHMHHGWIELIYESPQTLDRRSTLEE